MKLAKRLYQDYLKAFDDELAKSGRQRPANFLCSDPETWPASYEEFLEHYVAILSKETDQKDKALEKGRLEGVIARQVKAATKHETLDKAINDLFAKLESPGWRWGNKQIADFLNEKNLDYKVGTILQRVKKLAALHRSDGKRRTGL